MPVGHLPSDHFVLAGRKHGCSYSQSTLNAAIYVSRSNVDFLVGIAICEPVFGTAISVSNPLAQLIALLLSFLECKADN